MKILHVVTPRKKKDGSTYWHRIGTAFDGEKGIGIELDSLPIPDADGRCSIRLFEPREDGAQKRPQNRSQPDDMGGDTIPF